MIDEIVGEVVGNVVGELVVGSVSSGRRAWRALRRRSPSAGDPHRMPCAVRVIEGVHDGIGSRWRRTSAALSPGRIDLEEVELRVRQIEEAASGRHRLPVEEASHFPREYMWVLRVSTDHAVVEWAIPQTDLEWAVPLVTGRVTTTVQDRPLGRDWPDQQPARSVQMMAPRAGCDDPATSGVQVMAPMHRVRRSDAVQRADDGCASTLPTREERERP